MSLHLSRRLVSVLAVTVAGLMPVLSGALTPPAATPGFAPSAVSTVGSR